ncbi:hypothetical protein EW145_g7178 [Phellinidium pouzarii]|uniref:F-box domain-containing protein n=1 Tax=Phellinidium pouzarii TaxID=167371 RepID=A0A4S4KMY5_9AGAM|nr:hypothetical protein EW145_g7178 [Phellinidium pouzarii]
MQANDLASLPRSSPNNYMLPSPIPRLPPEILSMIFWHAIPRRSDFVEPSIHAAPLLLCRVCKQWRDLTERTPELWSSISLFLLRPYVNATQAFEKWISRSGNCPLSIKVVVLTCFADTRSEKHLHPLTDFMYNISKQSHRWLIADISVPGHYMEKLLANEAPILRRLTLSDPLVGSGDDVSTHQWEHVFRLSAAPALREFVLKQPLRIIPSPTHPIISVHFDAFSLLQVADLFNGCSQLVDLDISFRNEVLFDTEGIWTFNRLRTLRVCLHYQNSREMAKFLDHLCLPAVRSLTIDGLRSASDLHLAQLLDRTDGRLESLTLLNISFLNNDIVKYLSRVQFLRSLHLVDTHGFNNRCVNNLVWVPGRHTNLLSVGTVGGMIISRGLGHSIEPKPLREIRFDGSKGQHDELLQREDIKMCILSGLVWKSQDDNESRLRVIRIHLQAWTMPTGQYYFA